MSEDCLYLNVFMPNNQNEFNIEKKRVLIIFEGQLFTLGNPADIPADDLISSEDIIVVTVGYRSVSKE